jgi:hypothetical protein
MVFPMPESTPALRWLELLEDWVIAALCVGVAWSLLTTFLKGARHVSGGLDPVLPAASARLGDAVRGGGDGDDRSVLPDLRDGVPGLLVEGPTAPLYPVCPPVAFTADRDPVLGRDVVRTETRARLRVMQGGR